jgi:hypothetical protein
MTRPENTLGKLKLPSIPAVAREGRSRSPGLSLVIFAALVALLTAGTLFGVAEAIHHLGMNPFENGDTL